ncbi:MAG TPA: UPF0182 family protein [Anaerolineae bacterium]|nr:UPF0182 family protein [Anaerolineae bacterium]
MNRNDIPEAFRRFLEEQSFDNVNQEGGDDGRPPISRPPRRPLNPWWRNRNFWIFTIIFIFLMSFRWLVDTYTEWLWFQSVNYDTVWITQWRYRVTIFLSFFLGSIILLLFNWRLALRQAKNQASPISKQLLQIPGLTWFIGGIALALAALAATATTNRWLTFLQYFNRTAYGVTDPIFNRDISFYMFSLPFYRFLQEWGIALLFFTLVGVVLIYVLGSLPEIQQQRWRPQNLHSFRRHVGILVAAIMLFWAASYWLDQYELNFSPRGVIVGASYTDQEASLPALRIQMGLMLTMAILAVVNAFRWEWKVLTAVTTLWLGSIVLLGTAYPAILQQYSVEPNEFDREQPFIKYNIEYTRLAFDLHDVDIRDFGTVVPISQNDLDENQIVLDNIRLWDYRPLQQTYSQLQGLRTYYQFGEVDIDRYVIDGKLRQVMLGGRELDEDNLPGDASWVNEYLEFTHGYGIVMNPVNRVTTQGQPEFFIQDLPPQSRIDLPIDRPEIYFGELMRREVLVNSGLEEFDYPSGNENVYSNYQGEGGIPISNMWRQMAFAFRANDVNIILSDYIDSETRILMHRQIEERVQEIAPFLNLDRDPYLVVADGRLVWILDAYTTSRYFPYANPAPGQRFNYIRNSVKITVDAYDGHVHFYLADPHDPIIRTYNQAFPNLLKPLSAMPATIRQHLRYPEDLFTIQANQYLKYHMTDPKVFYNEEDLWAVSREVFGSAGTIQGGAQEQPVEPYYVISTLPGEEDLEFLLIQPFTPVSKNNMVAWIAGRSDGDNYGQLVVYELSKSQLVFGPAQIEGRISQDSEISQRLTLWDQGGSNVIRGNLLVIPLNNSFLYVEPLYLLSSDTSALPELKQVIVASDNRLVMRETLGEALTALMSEDPAPAVDFTNTNNDTDDDGDGDTTTTPPLPVNATIEELIQSANDHYEAAVAAQQRGDWTTYGLELDALEQDLQRLDQLTQ